MNRNQIYKIYGTDYKGMTKEILAASDLKSLIPGPQTRICIKPNLIIAKPARMGATTHPEVVAGIIEYLREEGFNNIIIAESCWVGEDMDAAFERTGFRKLCREYDVPFRDVTRIPSHKVKCGNLELKVSDVVDEYDFLINVPVLKGHCQVNMTCVLKNVKGLIPHDEKRRFHAMGINKPLGHLGLGIRQDFIVVDNICGDPGFEEGGDPLVTNCIMTGLDPVLMDALACEQLGFSIEEVPYLGLAARLGLGSLDLSKAEITTLDANALAGRQEAASPTGLRASDVAGLIDDRESCSACYANLVGALVELKKEGMLDALEKSGQKIAIGQGHKGRTGRLGVGKCTCDYDTCIMGCPPEKEEIYKQLKEYIHGLR